MTTRENAFLKFPEGLAGTKRKTLDEMLALGKNAEWFKPEDTLLALVYETTIILKALQNGVYHIMTRYPLNTTSLISGNEAIEPGHPKYDELKELYAKAEKQAEENRKAGRQGKVYLSRGFELQDVD